jgi:hypothetical protein
MKTTRLVFHGVVAQTIFCCPGSRAVRGRQMVCSPAKVRRLLFHFLFKGHVKAVSGAPLILLERAHVRLP